MNRCLIVLPTFNEAGNIVPLLHEIFQVSPGADVLVVDDNSPDGTGREVKEVQLKETRLHLLERPGKNGLAEAYLAGFSWGLERSYEIFVQMDADFSHRPKDLPRLFDALATEDLVMGCRYLPEGGIGGWSRTRLFVSRSGNAYARTMLGLPFLDLTGGYNAWRREVLQQMRLSTIQSKGYAFQIELKYRAFLCGYRLKEIPIVFEKRRAGVSKMSAAFIWEAAINVLKLRGETGAEIAQGGANLGASTSPSQARKDRL